ncbi:LysE family translocator [Bartonella sp. DGB1]|uniref:LysE family translocator n=1 Tax=Bartonella sp. DGB1 TaxID=3239807 RepID=UPI0035253962
MALIIDNATRLGRKNALANVAGLCTATYCHGAFSILGVSAIIFHNQSLFNTVKMLGALYLFYMGIKAVKAGFDGIKIQQNFTTTNQINKNQTKLMVSYRNGFLTQILNPKVSLFYIAAFPKFLSYNVTIAKGFSLVTIHSFNIFTWFTLMTLFISFANKTLNKAHIRGYINIATGLVLTLFALFILIG